MPGCFLSILYQPMGPTGTIVRMNSKVKDPQEQAGAFMGNRGITMNTENIGNSLYPTYNESNTITN